MLTQKHDYEKYQSINIRRAIHILRYNVSIQEQHWSIDTLYNGRTDSEYTISLHFLNSHMTTDMTITCRSDFGEKPSTVKPPFTVPHGGNQNTKIARYIDGQGKQNYNLHYSMHKPGILTVVYVQVTLLWRYFTLKITLGSR